MARPRTAGNAKEIFKRIETLKLKGESDNAFCLRCGIDISNYKKQKDGSMGLGMSYLRRIAAACHISILWLETGEGDPTDIDLIPEQDPLVEGVNEVALQLVRAENKGMRFILEQINEQNRLMSEIVRQNQEIINDNRILMQTINALLYKNIITEKRE